MSVTVILAEMEELAPTPKEVICADARKDGQAMIVKEEKQPRHIHVISKMVAVPKSVEE